MQLGGNAISACFQKVNGQLRVVTDQGECLPSETPLTWGIQGPQGIAGVPGQQGPPGPSGVSGYEVVVGETAADSAPLKQLRVDCPDGKKTLGAGWSVLDSTSAILEGQATYFEPAFDGSHWLVNAKNNSSFATDWKLRLRVICASVGN